MIAWLRGEPCQFEDDGLVLNVQGVGYHVLCSKSTLESLQGLAKTDLYIYTHVREDALVLFGFLDLNEKSLFLNLIKVNGIGPRSALNILSATTWQNVIDLIGRGDVRGLSALPKIGKKTAEQIILTLQGQLTLIQDSVGKPKTVQSRDQILSALLNLGFRLNDIEPVVNRMDPQIDVEQGVREGLAILAQL